MAKKYPTNAIEGYLLCKACLSDTEIRRAWTISNGDASCLKHAELWAVDGEIDHEAAQYSKVYEKLRQLGFRDAF